MKILIGVLVFSLFLISVVAAPIPNPPPAPLEDQSDANASIIIIEDCFDNQKNQDESDVDCGGSCDPCIKGKSCNNHDDCDSEYCNNGKCKSKPSTQPTTTSTQTTTTPSSDQTPTSSNTDTTVTTNTNTQETTHTNSDEEDVLTQSDVESPAPVSNTVSESEGNNFVENHAVTLFFGSVTLNTLLLVIILLVVSQRKGGDSSSLDSPIVSEKPIHSFVQRQLDKGYTLPQIKEHLRQNGWDETDLESL